jgi:hypothetical protein
MSSLRSWSRRRRLSTVLCLSASALLLSTSASRARVSASLMLALRPSWLRRPALLQSRSLSVVPPRGLPLLSLLRLCPCLSLLRLCPCLSLSPFRSLRLLLRLLLSQHRFPYPRLLLPHPPLLLLRPKLPPRRLRARATRSTRTTTSLPSRSPSSLPWIRPPSRGLP